ncbi:MAG: DUF2867 domain-containing protein [Kineosporiaceae bacterium]
MTGTAPALRSLAFADIPRPDHADVAIAAIPADAPTDPRLWAETIFGLGSMPPLVRGLLTLRQALVPLLGLRPSPRDTFAVREVVGEEALIAADEPHLDFRVGVGVDAQARLVRVTTAVRLKGLRGRLYFAPVRPAHALITQAMLRSAVRQLAGPQVSRRPPRQARPS